MRKKSLGALVATVLVVAACGAQGQPSQNTPDASSAPAPTASRSIAPSGETVEITVGTDTGAELKFEPAEISVPAGAEVRLTFENRSTVPHNLTFQGPPNVATATIVGAGVSETLEFTAPDTGEYAFVCTLHPGMGGTLLVGGG